MRFVPRFYESSARWHAHTAGRPQPHCRWALSRRIEVILGRLRTAAGLCATPSSRKCHDYAVCSSLDFISLKHIVPTALKAAGGFAAADTRALEQGLVRKEQEKEKTSRERAEG